jgi:diguanylate cyclase
VRQAQVVVMVVQSPSSASKGNAGSIRSLVFAAIAIAVCSFAASLLSLYDMLSHADHATGWVLFASCCIVALLALGIVVRCSSIAAAIAEAERNAALLAGHDPLSGLPNRRSFKDRLDSELSSVRRGRNEGVAVLFLDLDKFKAVNDTFGHAAGDRLIVQFAERVNGLLRNSDTLSRFGGDEFAIIQTQIKHQIDAVALGKRILAAMAEPFHIGGGSAYIGVSIGIALAPQHGNDADALMQVADVALYQSKSEGRSRYTIFGGELGDKLQLKQAVEDELRVAIENNALELHYLPEVAAEDGRVLGLEALVRWPHPRLGLVPPRDFIPIAEASGLINALGDWVLKQACQDALKWPRHLSVSVNLSGIQIKSKDFVSRISSIITGSGIEPGRVVLELGEQVVVGEADLAEQIIMDLQAIGVRFALDDFGTGYSSLIYLRRFAFDKIKIDQSFLGSLEATGESSVLIHSVVHLGRALGLTIVAEGVETAEQRRLLQAAGCHEMQGFLFAHPMPAKQISSWLAKKARSAA